ncbi:DUF6603 domain-containing protein [Streptomyces sp. NPDC048290]|uniref:DUF6603 domain-containing protein n=1 Tax=Streptomyces sp. NPDC048290 TaxID=3155811 RepID=UPI0034153860
MASQVGTLGAAALALARLLDGLQYSFGPGGPRALARELGLAFPAYIDTDPAILETSGRAALQLAAVPPLVADLVDAAERDDTAAVVLRAARLAAAIGLAADAVDAVGPAFRTATREGSGIPQPEIDAFAAGFGTLVRDALIVTAVEGLPGVYELLDFTGAVESTPVPAGDAAHPAHVRRALHPEQLLSFLGGPGAHLRDRYEWGAPGYTGVLLLATLARLLRRMGVGVVDAGGPGAPLLDAVFLEIVPRGDVTPSGLALTVLYPLPEITLTEFDAGTWAAKLALALPLPVGTSVLLQADDQVTVVPPPGGVIDGELDVEITAPGADGPPFLLFGDPAGSRLSAGSVGGRIGLRLGWDAQAGHAVGALVFGAHVKDLRLVLDASQGDGFLTTVLGGGRLEAAFDLDLSFDTQHGLKVGGSGGLEAQIPVHIALGPVLLQTVYIAARVGGGTVPVELSAGFTVALGPVTATVERMGVVAALSLPPGGGNLGPLQLDLGFKPPSGIGLTVDAGIVTGGGYLYADPDRGEYAGALELEFAGFLDLKAIGLISTRLPDGSSGFSLLVVVTAEFGTGIQLGYGFTLLAVGGIIGLNRAMNLRALTEGVHTGRIESVMFPKDVVANAPRIISDLRQYFPPEEGTFLVGPMAKLGWGTPTLVSVSLGLIVEIPGNLAVLGVLKAALPTEQLPLLVLQVQFIGAIEFDTSRLWFYARLFESRILWMTIDGGMGLYVSWGENPDFVLSVGGFHPSYHPPQLPFPVPDRISVDILNGPGRLIRVSGYFAITSNTVQFGAEALLRLGFSDFGIEGHVTFDALFRFSPFAFVIGVSASVSLKAFGVGIFGIDLRFQLEGPAPWRAHGRGSISLLFFEISADFDITWGDEQQTTLPPVQVLELLAAELGKKEGWETRLPSGTTRHLVTLRPLPETDDLVLHPLGTLFVRQRTVPLGVRVDRIGAQRAADGDRFTLAVDPDSGLTELSTPDDKFPMAQFQDMDDAAKLSRPAYEDQDCGLELGARRDALDSPRAVRRSARYETHVFDTRRPHTRPGTTPAPSAARRTAVLAPPGTGRTRRYQDVPAAVFRQLLTGSSTSRSPLSRTEADRRQPFAAEDTVQVTGARFVVAYVRTNVQALPPAAARTGSGAATFRSLATAQDALTAWVAAEPSLAGALHVVRESEVAAPLATPGTWTSVAPAPFAAAGGEAVRLGGGQVLLTGGRDGDGRALASAALFDPIGGAWEPLPDMTAARSGHSATLLGDGTVLVAGGRDGTGRVLDSAELYDPVGRRWRTVPALPDARHGHTATALADGTVLIAGGAGPRGGTGEDGSLASAEVFEPRTGTWAPAARRPAPMGDARTGHRAVRLPGTQGRVLVVGGALHTGAGHTAALAYCEVYDPATRAWTPAPSLAVPRAGHTATPLADGTVLVTGGGTAAVEQYRPDSGDWAAVPAQPGPGRVGHRAVALRTGQLLVLGGTFPHDPAAPGLRGCPRYDPAARAWTSTGGTATGRSDAAVTELGDGRVLVTGGLTAAGPATPDGTDTVTAATEIYTP